MKAEVQLQGWLQNPSLFFAGVSAFTDTNSVWHAIALIGYNSGSEEVEAEYAVSGNYHDYILCTGASPSYDEIYWDATNNQWLYKVTNYACNTLALVENGIPTIDSGGSVDMMESSDTTASDFTNVGVIFSPSLQYYNGGWVSSTYADVHNNYSPVSSEGVGIICLYGLDVQVLNSYAPPQPDGSDPTYC